MKTPANQVSKIYTFHAGGTIGMAFDKVNHVWIPKSGRMERRLRKLEGVRERLGVFEERPVLIDSSELNTGHLEEIAEKIQQQYAKSDGMVILHGTDTMGYTANALAEMLKHPRKPIILTGSQVPLKKKLETDAISNLRGTYAAAAIPELHGVFQFFHHSLRPAEGLTKVHSSSQNAFQSMFQQKAKSVLGKYDVEQQSFVMHAELPKVMEVDAAFELMPVQRKVNLEVYTLDDAFHLPSFQAVTQHANGVIFQLGKGWERVAVSSTFQNYIKQQQAAGKVFANTQFEPLEAVSAKLYAGLRVNEDALMLQKRFRHPESFSPETLGVPKINPDASFQPLPDAFMSRSKTAESPIFHVYTLTPYMEPKNLTRLSRHSTGVLLETYGAGNAPTNPHFIKQLQHASQHSTLVNISQCPYGGVALLYETGRQLVEAGVLNGGTWKRDPLLRALRSKAVTLKDFMPKPQVNGCRA